MTMSITVNSTHRINIDGQIVDLTTQQLVELRDQIDQAISAKRTPAIKGWDEFSRELRPHNDCQLPSVTCKENSKLWSGVHTSQCGPVNAVQTHVQP